MKIGNFDLGHELEPYIVAEIGVNHEGKMNVAKEQIEAAKRGGAHAAKFQTYKAEKIASKYSPSYWDLKKEPTKSQFKLFQKYDNFDREDYVELAAHCAKVGIDFLSTPFDLDAVDWLSPMMPAIKIASADITNTPLIRKCSFLNKPLILSTGAASFDEISFAIKTAKEAGASDIVLLHCVLNYPTNSENANISMIRALKNKFSSHLIGYSDHVQPDAHLSAMVTASWQGAVILEKHFTHDKNLPGNDHYHAMDENDLRNFTSTLSDYRLLLGNNAVKDLRSEEDARIHARRSVVALGDLKPGDVLSEKNLICKRPAHGISPIHWDELIGREVRVPIPDDTLLTWDMLEND